MKLKDFSQDKLHTLFKIEWSNFRLLWHADYWDGPKSGLLRYNDQKYWYEVFDEPDNLVFRRFLVIELSEEQLREKEYWHELFRQKVGTHADYDDKGHRELGALQPKDQWNEFYDAYKNHLPLDISENQIVGWFEY